MSGARDVQLPPIQQDLKVASRELIRAYGGQDVTGKQFGRSQSRYCDAGSNFTSTFLNINEVGELEDRTSAIPGHPIVTRALAKRQGFELVARPRALPAPEDLIQCVGELMAEGGDVMRAVAEALKDKVWSKAEAIEAGGHVDDLILVAVTMRAALTAIEMGDA